MSMSNSKDKKSFIVSNEVLVDFKISARVNLDELEIYPESMSKDQIRSKLIKALHEILDDSESINISTYGVKVHADSATTRSIPMMADDEEIK
jgi:activator of HSP90 ATPase